MASVEKVTLIQATKSFPKSFSENLKIDLNLADSTTFTLLKGIGPGFASRIIKYRKKLGGFYKKEQLKEVYGLDSILFNRIEKSIHLQNLDIKKFNINLVSIDELRKHPYFSYNIATSIVNYRKAHGLYKDILEIKNIILVNADLYVKLVNYIKVD